MLFLSCSLVGSSEVVPLFPKELPKDKSTRELVSMATQAHIVCSQQRYVEWCIPLPVIVCAAQCRCVSWGGHLFPHTNPTHSYHPPVVSMSHPSDPPPSPHLSLSPPHVSLTPPPVPWPFYLFSPSPSSPLSPHLFSLIPPPGEVPRGEETVYSKEGEPLPP